MFDRPINGETFTAYVEQALVPTLTPGDVVVLDNLGSHKGKAVRQAIRNAGAHLLFLPPYIFHLYNESCLVIYTFVNKPQKDHHLLIEAFCRLRNERGARLVILGNGACGTNWKR